MGALAKSLCNITIPVSNAMKCFFPYTPGATGQIRFSQGHASSRKTPFHGFQLCSSQPNGCLSSYWCQLNKTLEDPKSPGLL